MDALSATARFLGANSATESTGDSPAHRSTSPSFRFCLICIGRGDLGVGECEIQLAQFQVLNLFRLLFEGGGERNRARSRESIQFDTFACIVYDAWLQPL